jgi:hypothetical protein
MTSLALHIQLALDRRHEMYELFCRFANWVGDVQLDIGQMFR